MPEQDKKENQYLIDIQAPKDTQYFIALGQQAQHSFIQVGALIEGVPRIFSRIAKLWDVDPGVMNKDRFVAHRGLSKEGILSRVAEDRKKYDYNFNYQAYDISYEQLKEYLLMLKEIENAQNKIPEINQAIMNMQSSTKKNMAADPNNKKYSDDVLEFWSYAGIKCYIPREKPNGEVVFEYQKLSDYNPPQPTDTTKLGADIIASAVKIKYGETCRTTGRKILEAVLGFKTTISDWYCIKPKYPSVVRKGETIDADSFYSLPPPPNSFSFLTNDQRAVFEQVYAKLESIPTKYTTNPKTKEKFNALKLMYIEMCGKLNPNQTLSIAQLLADIVKHEYISNEALFSHRGASSFKARFGFETSTKKMFNNIKKILEDHKVDEKPNSGIGFQRGKDL